MQVCASVSLVYSNTEFQALFMYLKKYISLSTAVAAKVIYSAHLHGFLWNRRPHSRCAAPHGCETLWHCLSKLKFFVDLDKWRSKAAALYGSFGGISSASPFCVLTVSLTVVLIPWLKIAWVFYSMYVCGLGGAKLSSASAGACRVPCFYLTDSPLQTATNAEPFGQAHTARLWPGLRDRDHNNSLGACMLQPW